MKLEKKLLTLFDKEKQKQNITTSLLSVGNRKRGKSSIQCRSAKGTDIMGTKYKHTQGPKVGKRSRDTGGRPYGGGEIWSGSCKRTSRG